MGIKLDVSVQTPLSDDDRDILAGISVMVLAIANRQDLVEQEVPPKPCLQQHPDRPGLYCVAPVGHDGDHLYDEYAADDAVPLDCGTVWSDASGSCVREPGHSGRHRYRPFNGLVNRGDVRHAPPEKVAASWDRSAFPCMSKVWGRWRRRLVGRRRAYSRRRLPVTR